MLIPHAYLKYIATKFNTLNMNNSDSDSFAEFAYFLQAYLHDEGVFSTREISKVTTKLPAHLCNEPSEMTPVPLRKRNSYFNDFNLYSRRRYLLSDQKLSLVFDHDEDIYFKDSNFSSDKLSSRFRRKHKLLVVKSKLLREEYQIESSSVNKLKNSIMNVRTALNHEILGNHRMPLFSELDTGDNLTSLEIDDYYKARLLVDLPDNLKVFKATYGSNNYLPTELVGILRTVQRIPDMLLGLLKRNLSDEEIRKNNELFVNELIAIMESVFGLNSFSLDKFFPVSWYGNDWVIKTHFNDIRITWRSSSQHHQNPAFEVTISFLVANSWIYRSFEISGLSLAGFEIDGQILQSLTEIVKYIRLLCTDLLITSESYKN